MNTMTMKHDRKVRTERQAAKARAEREQERANRTEKVKRDALKMAVTDSEIKSRLKILDIAGPVFDELAAEERISILENYIEAMITLRNQMLEKFGSNNGLDTDKQIKKIEWRIDAAGAEIVRISAKEIELTFEQPEPV